MNRTCLVFAQVRITVQHGHRSNELFTIEYRRKVAYHLFLHGYTNNNLLSVTMKCLGLNTCAGWNVALHISATIADYIRPSIRPSLILVALHLIAIDTAFLCKP